MCEGECGSGIACGDGVQLAKELQQLRADPRRAQLMGQRARALFDEQYTLDAALAKWAQLLSRQGISVKQEACASRGARLIA
jgi:hypothetical protein